MVKAAGVESASENIPLRVYILILDFKSHPSCLLRAGYAKDQPAKVSTILLRAIRIDYPASRRSR